MFDEIDLKKDANGNEEVKESEDSGPEPNLKISTDVESDSGISGSSPASSKKNINILKDTKEDDEQDVTTSTPSDGREFQSHHDKVKAELQEKMDAASKDLENADVSFSILRRSSIHQYSRIFPKNVLIRYEQLTGTHTYSSGKNSLNSMSSSVKTS